MNTCARHRKKGGFTIIELMVVLAVAGVLASLAAPSFKEFILGQRIKNAAYELNASLAYARSEAIMRNRNVTLGKNGTWAGGWNVASTGTGATTLRTQDAFKKLVIDDGTDGGVPADVTYDSGGRTGASVTFRVKVADSSIAHAAPRYVCLSLTGKPYNKESACP